MKIVMATAIMLNVLAATPAPAATLPPAAAEVHFGDLDLTTVTGFRTLQARITAAARGLCEADNGITADRRLASDRCVRTAYRHAMRRLSVVEG